VPGRRKTFVPLLATALFAVAAPAAAAQRSVIGHSVRGRAIVALHQRAVDTTLRVLVVGCVHGNETAGIPIARRLAAEAPPRRTDLWAVPTINPDGVAADTRGNARGVDLNRSFPFRWRHLGGLEYSGSGPLSEPESRAAARLIRRLEPELTIWFHQPLALVDRSGGDPFVERRFADLFGLPLVQLARYPGSASSWQNHTIPGSTAFVVELPHAAGPALTRRAAAAVRALAAELASPVVRDNHAVG
jgi:protein MpaA